MEDPSTTSDSLALDRICPSAFERSSCDREPRQADDLHICPGCGSALVMPTDWAPAPDQRWHVRLRCPECEWTGGGLYPQAVVDRFDEVLDLATEAILNDLQLLTTANMEDEITRFAAALAADQILPCDF
jgi:hypothetical protein